MAAIGRNEPCHCGSGKKYKHCCLNAGSKASMKNRLLLGAIAIVLLGGALVLLTNLDELTHSEGGATRVWSEAHGHWH